MKFMFISDIHGSAYWLERALEKVKEEQADYIILLGDYLYHGPRNPLPEGYDPQKTATLLNDQKERVIAIRGNCDAEVDQMLLEFPMMGDYSILFHEGRRIFVTHGHGFHMEQLPPLTAGDVFIQGHTHIPVAEKREEIYVLNPGSIALPKGNYASSYGVLEGNTFAVKDFDGGIVKEIVFS